MYPSSKCLKNFSVDSIAKNIDQYFNIQLVKDAEKDEMVHKIEQEILDFSMDEEDVSEKSNEQDFEIPPLPEELKEGAHKSSKIIFAISTNPQRQFCPTFGCSQSTARI